ncbi:DUF2993 domain-containing protein [Streptomyces sp. NPDC050803]|uniref:LmeA family phospholipid-binding protein n=1 Tax=unclassified Streptomyces TaxID=2593676 RepID=UPI003433037F
MHENATLYRSPAHRWRRRPVVVAGAVLLATAVPLTLDRVAAARAEAHTADAFQKGMGTPEPPEVHVRGFPALTQVASGTLRQVDITAHDIPADGDTRPLPVTELDLQLSELTKSDDDSEARARSAEAIAHLSYRDLSDALGLEVSRGEDPGRFGASVLIPLSGEVTVTTAVSAASGNRVAFDDFEVTGGVLPAVGRAALERVFQQPIQLQGIPEGLRLRSVTATANGVDARFSGESVTFRPYSESVTFRPSRDA